MDLYLKLIDDADTELVTLTEQKVQCQIDESDTAFDAALTQAIKAARHAIENQIGRKIGVQRLEYGLKCWPECGWSIKLPRPPLVEIESIKYTKQDGTIVTWYGGSPLVNPGLIIETAAEPGEVFIKFDTTWPPAVLAYGFPIKIIYRAGYAAIPEDLKNCILMLTAHLFAHREAIDDQETFEVAKGMEWMYSPYIYSESV
jgi:uncharacterized phiE125 gp8 family phage protein